jgi:hypothetical protein
VNGLTSISRCLIPPKFSMVSFSSRAPLDMQK